MSARSVLLEQLDSLREAVDLPILLDAGVPSAVRNRLVAGIAITGFITLEQFIAERGVEIAGHVSGGSSRYSEVPEATRALLLRRTGRGLVSMLQRKDLSEPDRIAAAGRVGRVLVGLDGANLMLAPEALRWAGSNLQKDDLEDGLRLLGCQQAPWEALSTVLRRAERGRSSSSVKAAFETLADGRHRTAHSLTYVTTVTVLRSIPRLVLEVAMTWDCLASHLAQRLRQGDLPGIPANADGVVRFRWVEQTKAGWRHIAEDRARGSRCRSQDEAWRVASSAAAAAGETVVLLDRAGEIEVWEPAFLP